MLKFNYCPECGAKHERVTNFCTQCGYAFNAKASTPKPKAGPVIEDDEDEDEEGGSGDNVKVPDIDKLQVDIQINRAKETLGGVMGSAPGEVRTVRDAASKVNINNKAQRKKFLEEFRREGGTLKNG